MVYLVVVLRNKDRSRGSETESRSQVLGALPWNAVRSAGLPLKVFDSSTGFCLPDGSVLSPDATTVRQECR